MKRTLLLLFVFIANLAAAQKAYIQVSGEPDLSVFLNGEFKGKTSKELEGYIIDNVNPGANLIKVAKAGYLPYEETIQVKPGEVFNYKVKPFNKQAVTVSESGNTVEADQQAKAKVGSLVLQSVPIGITVSIPAIEGLVNMKKGKDEWTVNDIPTGGYDIELSFGSKVVKKRFYITEGDVTTAFANLLTGEFTTGKKLGEEKRRIAADQYLQLLMTKYGYVRGASLSQFFAANPGAALLASYPVMKGRNFHLPEKNILKNPSLTPGPRDIVRRDDIVVLYTYCLASFKTLAECKAALKNLAGQITAGSDPSLLNGFEPQENVYRFVDGDRKLIIDLNVSEWVPGHYELCITFNDLNHQ